MYNFPEEPRKKMNTGIKILKYYVYSNNYVSTIFDKSHHAHPSMIGPTSKLRSKLLLRTHHIILSPFKKLKCQTAKLSMNITSNVPMKASDISPEMCQREPIQCPPLAVPSKFGMPFPADRYRRKTATSSVDPPVRESRSGSCRRRSG